MLETTTPALASLDAFANVTDLLARRAAEAPEHVAFEVPTDDASSWRPVTTAAFLDDVRTLAKGMMGAGLAAGDTVAIMAPTRYEWAVADLATWFAGGVVVPVYDSSSASQVDAIVRDAGVRLAVAARTPTCWTRRSRRRRPTRSAPGRCGESMASPPSTTS